MKYAAFDLELADPLQDGIQVWQAERQPGISCAAVALTGGGYQEFSGVPRMDCAGAAALVEYLSSLHSQGFRLLSWNGCAFDFAVLAAQSGLRKECAGLALNHTDLMLMVTFTKGYYLSLDKALQGALLKGKAKEVTLRSGAVLQGMSGAMAPELWQAGEHDAVRAYLREDVCQLLELAEEIERSGRIFWFSNSGKPQFVKVPVMATVAECHSIPLPDTSWMQNPPTREQFTAWMGEFAE